MLRVHIKLESVFISCVDGATSCASMGMFPPVSAGVVCVCVLTLRVNNVEGCAVLGEADCEESAQGCQQQQQLTEQKRRSLAHGCSQTTRFTRVEMLPGNTRSKKHAFCYFSPPAAGHATEQKNVLLLRIETHNGLSGEHALRGGAWHFPSTSLHLLSKGRSAKRTAGCLSVLDAAEGRSVRTRCAVCALQPASALLCLDHPRSGSPITDQHTSSSLVQACLPGDFY